MSCGQILGFEHGFHHFSQIAVAILGVASLAEGEGDAMVLSWKLRFLKGIVHIGEKIETIELACRKRAEKSRNTEVVINGKGKIPVQSTYFVTPLFHCCDCAVNTIKGAPGIT